jgi:hypothetical protein
MMDVLGKGLSRPNIVEMLGKDGKDPDSQSPGRSQEKEHDIHLYTYTPPT